MRSEMGSALLGIASVAGALLSLLLFCVHRKRRNSVGENLASPLLDGTGSSELVRPPPIAMPEAPRALRTFTPDEIDAATDGFSALAKLDEGSFGLVYRGEIDDDTVAIKVLKMSVTDPRAIAAFKREADLLGAHKHRNLVGLLGFCLSDDAGTPFGAKQCLVFEFMAGGSLRDRLRGAGRWGTPLSCPERFDIASDVARGLVHLHTVADPPIIHQDIKSANILLEYDGPATIVAKIADFGAARITPTLKTGTHHSTANVVGTQSYMPTEYTTMGHVSEKTDTFAFGVVLLELLTGANSINRETGENLSVAMYSILGEPKKALEAVLDERLGKWSAAARKAAHGLGAVARQCVEPLVSQRCRVSDVLQKVDKLAGRQSEAFVRSQSLPSQKLSLEQHGASLEPLSILSATAEMDDNDGQGQRQGDDDARAARAQTHA